MPHTHFLTQRDATCFDIIFWMLWAADDGEATIRALLPWAGVPPGVATDEAVESLQISVSRGAGGRTKFAVGQQFVAPITGEVMLAYQALADALLASIAKTSCFRFFSGFLPAMDRAGTLPRDKGAQASCPISRSLAEQGATDAV